jgi:hypothetical protein
MGLGQLGIQSGAIYNDWSQIDLLINKRTTWFWFRFWI